MSNQTKLEFRLVPTKGVASGKGFRAEWTRKNEVIDKSCRLCALKRCQKSGLECA